jgi:hypothetical protein
MARKTAKGLGITENPEKYYLFLNPYEEYRFTKCPKCDKKTKIRKFPLVISINPGALFLLNKSCKFCEKCQLIITRKREVEGLMAFKFSSVNPEIIGNDYLVIGTLERKDWQGGSRGLISSKEILERVIFFKDHLEFEVIPARWELEKSE